MPPHTAYAGGFLFILLKGSAALLKTVWIKRKKVCIRLYSLLDIISEEKLKVFIYKRQLILPL